MSRRARTSPGPTCSGSTWPISSRSSWRRPCSSRSWPSDSSRCVGAGLGVACSRCVTVKPRRRPWGSTCASSSSPCSRSPRCSARSRALSSRSSEAHPQPATSPHFAGLALTLFLVVGGVALVTGALFGGILQFVLGLVAIEWASRFTRLLEAAGPAFAAIGLARNPFGAAGARRRQPLQAVAMASRRRADRGRDGIHAGSSDKRTRHRAALRVHGDGGATGQGTRG